MQAVVEATGSNLARYGAMSVAAYRGNDAETSALIQATLRDVSLRRSEEHTSELQSLMRISYAVFCLTKKKDHVILSNTHVKLSTKHTRKNKRKNTEYRI